MNSIIITAPLTYKNYILKGEVIIPDYILLGSNHKWFACYQWSEVQNIAKEMFKNGCDYVKVIKNNEVTHWTINDIKI